MKGFLRFLLMYRLLFREIVADARCGNHLASEHERWVELRTKVALLHMVTPRWMRSHVGQWLRDLAAEDSTNVQYHRMMMRAADHFSVCSRIETIAETAVSRLRESGLVK